MNEKLIANLKFLSNLDNCESSDDMQYALTKIYDLLENNFPNILEDND
jgi:hypothetical protein